MLELNPLCTENLHLLLLAFYDRQQQVKTPMKISLRLDHRQFSIKCNIIPPQDGTLMTGESAIYPDLCFRLPIVRLIYIVFFTLSWGSQ